ncbi:MAG: efflux RND transporter periplasmic adaptor subunit [Gemmatimonadetes bacterium]|nr:efflux RND transporter periplasmic adaptor subunit [Gemmatimonadota bacterium]
MSTRRQVFISLAVLAVAGAAVAGYTATTRGQEKSGAAAGHEHAAMAGASGDELQPVHLDPEAARRIGVTYAVAQRKPFRRTVATVGNVTYDETRLANLNPKIEGWVERLHIDFTGAPVRRGEPLMDIYSPMLVAAQEELILARRLADAAVDGSGGRAERNAQDLLESARRRFGYWDIPEDEVARIERSGAPRKTLTLRAPATGIVVEKNVVEGARIMPGMDVYKIADLSQVWIEGEVFEKDLSLVHLGQPARVTFDAYPGEVFEGRVTYVYPTVAVEARTGRIRVELPNPQLRFKPGMYAKLELAATRERDALMIPRSAVHFTGERALVFVRGRDGMLVPREVSTGLVAAEEIEVLAGLAEGDVVVSSANFLIDAEANMGRSMSSMPGMGTRAEPEAGTTEERAGPVRAPAAQREEERGGAPASPSKKPQEQVDHNAPTKH